MAPDHIAQLNKRDQSSENFNKRWRILKNNGFNVHKTYRAEVYLCLWRNGKIYEFKSTDKARPLSEDEIVRIPLGVRGGVLTNNE
jgi:hypothetical protein